MLINQGVDVLEVVGVGVFRGKNDYALGHLSVEVTPSIFMIMGLLLSLLSLFYYYLFWILPIQNPHVV